MSNPINEKRSMTVLLWNYLENRDIFLTFAGKMKKLVIIFTLLVAPFTVQDVKPYVQFFDDHGTPNDRLLAHYLLGRAYYEAGEAPMALECYQKALDCADTTAKGFDFCTLSSAYSQMATLYHSQLLLINEIEARKKASHYAFRAKSSRFPPQMFAAPINFSTFGLAFAFSNKLIK